MAAMLACADTRSYDGYGLLASLEREQPELAATVLIFTGDVGGDMDANLPVPRERILSKPFDAAVLVQIVRRSLGIA